MAQRKERDTVVLAVRVSIQFAEAVYTLTGGQERFPEWARALFASAITGGNTGAGTLLAQGFQEGKRQGWSHANAIFRKALQAAAAELKK